VDDRVGRQMPQPFGQANPLDRVVGEQQGMLQVEALGVRAVQPLVKTGTGQVVGRRVIAQLQHTLGVDQRTDVVVVGKVQLAQVARQPLQHLPGFGGEQVLGAELQVRAVLALQQFAAIVGVQPASAARVEQVVGPWHPQQEMPGKLTPTRGISRPLASSSAISPRARG